jgi:hypothetical protein
MVAGKASGCLRGAHTCVRDACVDGGRRTTIATASARTEPNNNNNNNTLVLTTCAHTLCGTLTRPSMRVHQVPSTTLTFHHCWRCSGSDPHDSPGATLCVVLREQHCSLAEAADFAKVFLSSLTPSVVCALAAVGGTDATAAALSCVCCCPDRDVEATANSPTALLACCRQRKNQLSAWSARERVWRRARRAHAPLRCKLAAQILVKTMLQSSIAAHRGGPRWWGYALTRSTLLRCPCLHLSMAEQFRAHVCTTEKPSPPLCVAAAASS